MYRNLIKNHLLNINILLMIYKTLLKKKGPWNQYLYIVLHEIGKVNY